MGKTYYKVVVCIFIMHLCTFTLNAQVGIGTTTPAASAQLDITSTDRGFLMPRVALTSTTDTATINGAEVTSLLVYNTATVTDVTPGFYYWYGAQWVTLGGTTPAAWELTGNTGTNPNTNFLGTIDGQDLVIRTNNVETLRVTQPDGSNDIQLIAGYNGNRGTINNPLYAFSNDLDTGIWSDGGDEFSLGAGGREFITIDEAAQDVLILNDRSQDIDLRIETNNENEMLFIDGGNDRIGIMTATPATEFNVGGNTSVVRIDALNAVNNANNNGIDPSPVYADANGNLTLEGPLVQNTMPVDDTTLGTTGTTLAVPANAPLTTALLLTTNVNLTQNTLVEVLYQVGARINYAGGTLIEDGSPRIYGVFAILGGNLIGTSSSSYTCIPDDSFGTPDPITGDYNSASGAMYLNGNGYAELTPGNYVLEVYGYLFGASYPTEAVFGAANIDRVQVILHH